VGTEETPTRVVSVPFDPQSVLNWGRAKSSSHVFLDVLFTLPSLHDCCPPPSEVPQPQAPE